MSTYRYQYINCLPTYVYVIFNSGHYQIMHIYMYNINAIYPLVVSALVYISSFEVSRNAQFCTYFCKNVLGEDPEITTKFRELRYK